MFGFPIVSTDFIHTSKKRNTNCEETHSLLVQNQVTETKNTALVILPEYNSEEVSFKKSWMLLN